MRTGDLQRLAIEYRERFGTDIRLDPAAVAAEEDEEVRHGMYVSAIMAQERKLRELWREWGRTHYEPANHDGWV